MMYTIIKSMKSFKYAFRGLYLLYKHEHNIRIHLVASVVAIGLGFVLKITTFQWYLIILCIGFVLTAEAMNSAIEKLVDHISPEENEWAGRIKDLSAAGVLLAALGAAIVGVIIFIPKLISLL